MPFNLALLGPFQLSLGPEPNVVVTSPKIQALLGYLAVEGSHPHPRDRLAELLWPGQMTGRQNLRQSLSRSQKILARSPNEPSLLHITRRDIALNPAATQQVDVCRFLAALAAVRSHQHEEAATCSACLPHLEKAAALYRGDLLAGIFVESPAFEEWLLARRAWLQQEILWVLDALTRHALAQANNQKALHFARRQLQVRPLREKAHHQVIEALLLDGRRSEALSHYTQLAARLRQELDVAPAAAITALVEDQRKPANGLAPSWSLPASSPAHHLPPQFTPLIGREEILTLIQETLAQHTCRILTLVGPGGMGKTRLATEVAQRQLPRFRGNVRFVDLTPLDTAAQLPGALAGALGMILPSRARSPQEQQDALVRLLADQALLLVLDNYEHLLPDVELVAKLLQGTNELCLLVTSRVPLHLRAEWLIDVDGLPVPPEDADTSALDATHFPAMALFEQAARRVKHDFVPSDEEQRIIARICRLVQGSPLALELASAKVRASPLAQMADAIEEDLDFLSTTMADVPTRHQSLRAIIDHSWQLLSPVLQAIFARLAVFRDPFTEEAAHAVAGANLQELEELVRQSLLKQVQGDRYGLHGSLRQYAREKLAVLPTLQSEIQRRHGIFYLALLTKQEDRLWSQEAPVALASLRRDLNNIRAAWSWAVENSHLGALDGALDAAYRFFNAGGLVQEGRATVENALQAYHSEHKHQGDRAVCFTARLLAKQARFLNLQGLYEQATEAAQTTTQELSALTSEGESPQILATKAEAWLQWGRAALHLARYQEAESHLEEALGWARTARSPQMEAEIHLNLGTLHTFQNTFQAAKDHTQRALDLARTCGDLYLEGLALNNLGTVADFQGDYDTAAMYFEEALAVFEAVDYRRGRAAALSNLGVAVSWRGELHRAMACHEEARHAARALGDIDGEAWAFMALGAVSIHMGRLEDARVHLHAALVLNSHDGTRTLEAWCLHHLAQMEFAAGHLDEAENLAQQAQFLAEELGDELTVAAAQLVYGEVATQRKDFAAAEAACRQALEVNRRMGHGAGQMRALAAWSRLALAQGDPAQACVLAEQALALEGTDDLLLERAPLLAVYGQGLTALGDPRSKAVQAEATALHCKMRGNPRELAGISVEAKASPG